MKRTDKELKERNKKNVVAKFFLKKRQDKMYQSGLTSVKTVSRTLK